MSGLAIIEIFTLSFNYDEVMIIMLYVFRTKKQLYINILSCLIRVLSILRITNFIRIKRNTLSFNNVLNIQNLSIHIYLMQICS